MIPVKKAVQYLEIRLTAEEKALEKAIDDHLQKGVYQFPYEIVDGLVQQRIAQKYGVGEWDVAFRCRKTPGKEDELVVDLSPKKPTENEEFNFFFFTGKTGS